LKTSSEPGTIRHGRRPRIQTTESRLEHAESLYRMCAASSPSELREWLVFCAAHGSGVNGPTLDELVDQLDEDDHPWAVDTR